MNSGSSLLCDESYYKTLYLQHSKSLVGKNMVLHLVEDNIYISIKFTSWSSGTKGGFAYERSTPK